MLNYILWVESTLESLLKQELDSEVREDSGKLMQLKLYLKILKPPQIVAWQKVHTVEAH